MATFGLYRSENDMMVWVTQCIGYICLCFIYAINQTTIKTETRGQWVASLIWSPITNVQNSHQTKDDIPKHWPLFYVELQKNLLYFLDPLTVKFYVVCVTLFLQRIKKKWIKWAGPRTKEDMHTEKLSRTLLVKDIVCNISLLLPLPIQPQYKTHVYRISQFVHLSSPCFSLAMKLSIYSVLFSSMENTNNT